MLSSCLPTFGIRLSFGLALAIAGIGLVWSAPALYGNVFERLLYQSGFRPDRTFAFVHENRSGVITVSRSGTVYGDGAYDGQFNVDPLPGHDINRVIRAYAVPAFHPAPHDILMIGLGSGSWLQVLLNHPDARSVTVVEINPGYVEVVKNNPVVASAPHHPKVTVGIDDGRHLLRRTERRFDVIVQNTIVHWRAHASRLLSREYLELSRARLKPGGVVYYNSTDSAASQKTGATVFPHAWRFQNMIVASDDPIAVDRSRWRQKMLEWRIDGLPALSPDDAAQAASLVQPGSWRGGPDWEHRVSILRRTLKEPVVTDDNMATEWWTWNTYR